MTRKFKIKSLLLITGNPGKAREIRDLLDIKELEFDHAPLDLPEVQSMSLEEIGKFKTEAALRNHSRVLGFDAVLTDDTGLSCAALNGLPGPLIKWFLDCLGVDGLLKLTKNENDSGAEASCLLSLGLTKSKKIIQFRKNVQGKLTSPRGDNGFGWDKIFIPSGHSLTYAEMTLDQKNLISHRTLAIRELRRWML